MVRLAELEVETTEAAAALNRLLETTINDLNRRAGEYPRIMVERPIP
jgi:hypothetical protein